MTSDEDRIKGSPALKRALGNLLAINDLPTMAVHLMFPRFMNDNNDDDRTKAITMGLNILARCDELWCFGEKISKGMLIELMFASNYMIKIRHFTEDCVLIPKKDVMSVGY